jgi:hypothetical protein
MYPRFFNVTAPYVQYDQTFSYLCERASFAFWKLPFPDVQLGEESGRKLRWDFSLSLAQKSFLFLLFPPPAGSWSIRRVSINTTMDQLSL